jgi:hypothetical protein
MVMEQETKARAKYLRVKVIDNTKDGRPSVNVRLPIGVAKFGLKMAAMFSPDVKKADLDWDVIAATIDEGVTGELVHVEDEAEHKTIDVFVE